VEAAYCENLRGGGGCQKILKILIQICDYPERYQKFSEKIAFLSRKSKKFLLKWWGRVAFNENFIGGGEGIL
jgi:hypothetical protein